MDVCPVGAITTRDYRFKARPWDNPEAVDTICTLCEKGCNTTAWLKAKPEWAKGARLARMTPRFNPEVNGYWMCDIGRFDYHWIEGDGRLDAAAASRGAPASWSQALARLSDACRRAPADLRRCVSSSPRTRRSKSCLSWAASAARSTCPERASRSAGARASSRSRRTRSSRCRAVDAPNVRGARDLGFPVNATASGDADLSAFRADVEAGRVQALYVFDPGPDGSIGDVSWVIAAKKAGTSAPAHRAGRPDDGAGQGGRRRSAWRIVDREGRDLRQPGRPAAGVGARHVVARRSAGRLEDPRPMSALALGAAVAYQSSAEIRAELAARWPATRPTPA